MKIPIPNPLARWQRQRGGRRALEAVAAQLPGIPTPAETPRQSPVRMALIVATSALLGGITVAVWNRRLLEGIRQPEAASPPANARQAPSDEEFI